MNRIVTAVVVGLLIFAAAGIAVAQERAGSLRRQVLDELGGAIVGATMTAIDAKGTEKTVTTNNNGVYTINGLAPGKYTLRVVAGRESIDGVDAVIIRGDCFLSTLRVDRGHGRTDNRTS